MQSNCSFLTFSLSLCMFCRIWWENMQFFSRSEWELLQSLQMIHSLSSRRHLKFHLLLKHCRAAACSSHHSSFLKWLVTTVLLTADTENLLCHLSLPQSSQKKTMLSTDLSSLQLCLLFTCFHSLTSLWVWAWWVTSKADDFSLWLTVSVFRCLYFWRLHALIFRITQF